MVRIIGGDVVQDDDPRLRPAASAAPGATPSTRRSAGQGSHAAHAREGAALDWSAPPFRLLQREGGLPDIEVYGLRMPMVALLAIAGAGMAFGWRGLLGVGILYYLYLIRPQSTGQRPQSAGQGLQQAAGGLQQLFQQGAAGLGVGSGGSGGGGATKQPAGSTPAGSGSSSTGAFSGKSYKLSGS